MHAGCLHNLSELARRRNNRPARGSAVSPRFAGDPNNAFASSLERKGSIERSLDLGAMTASTVLGLYLDGQQEGNELIMLSELQVGLCCSRCDGWLQACDTLLCAYAAAHDDGVCAGASDEGRRTSMLLTCVVHLLAHHRCAAHPVLVCSKQSHSSQPSALMPAFEHRVNSRL
jgi:hypothetical protein